jgi:hypothetical protein
LSNSWALLRRGAASRVTLAIDGYLGRRSDSEPGQRRARREEGFGPPVSVERDSPDTHAEARRRGERTASYHGAQTVGDVAAVRAALACRATHLCRRPDAPALGGALGAWVAASARYTTDDAPAGRPHRRDRQRLRALRRTTSLHRRRGRHPSPSARRSRRQRTATLGWCPRENPSLGRAAVAARKSCSPLTEGRIAHGDPRALVPRGPARRLGAQSQ